MPLSLLMPTASPPLSRASLVLLAAAVALTLAAAMAFRLGVIEPRAAGFACLESAAPWWCAPREAVIRLAQTGVLGWLSLGAGALALLLRRPWPGVIALLSGAAGLALYDAGTSAVGVVLGLIAVSRAGATKPAPPAATP